MLIPILVGSGVLFALLIAVLAMVWAGRGHEGVSPGPGNQRPGSGPLGVSPGLLILLQNLSVRNELQLSQEQRTALGALVQQIRTQYQPEFARLRDQGTAGGPSAGVELRKTVRTAVWEALATILSPQQQQRLREVELQCQGPEVLTNTEVQTALGLTEDQKPRIEDLLDRFRKDAQDLVGKAREQKNPQFARTGMIALRRQSLEQAAALLTETQKATFRNLLGSPFELQPNPGGPPPGGGPGRGPQGFAGPDLADI
jgi:hypothetical protein